MSGTDELCRLLDERGVEWKDGDAAYETEWSTPDGRHCSAMYWKPTFSVLISGCTPEQAIAATLGSDKLTAEQVRKAIFDGSVYASYDGAQYYADGINMQAIADELNTTLDVGECELTYGETDNGVDSWFTQCGGRFNATFEDGRMVHPKFCQMCGGKAVER